MTYLGLYARGELYPNDGLSKVPPTSTTTLHMLVHALADDADFDPTRDA